MIVAGIRVDEDDAVAFLAQRPARLHAGVVELGGLPDDDRARADHHDGTPLHPAQDTADPGAGPSGRWPSAACRTHATMRAVVTAGGLVDGAFAARSGPASRRLHRSATARCSTSCCDACAGAGIDGVAVVGGPEVRAHLAGTGVRAIDAAADGGTNLLRALDAWPGERILFLTSDLPFATADGVRDVVARSAPFALTMALADVGAYEARFPEAPAHSVALGGERVANGNAFVIAPEAVAPLRAFAVRFFAARKSLPKMALLLGPSLIVRYVARRLAIAGRRGARVAAARRAGVRAARMRSGAVLRRRHARGLRVRAPPLTRAAWARSGSGSRSCGRR